MENIKEVNKRENLKRKHRTPSKDYQVSIIVDVEDHEMIYSVKINLTTMS